MKFVGVREFKKDYGGEDLKIRKNRLEKERHGTNSSQY